jgi:arylsulfatase A-like enzyme
VPPARHGVLSNTWTAPQPPVPSLIEVVHQATSTHPPPPPDPHTPTLPHPHTPTLPHSRTAAFYDWEQLRDLAPPGALDFAYYHRLGDPPQDRDLEIGAVAASYLVEHAPALAFVYLGATDAVGHRHGWMSEPYLQAVASADRAIGLVLEPLRASGALAHTVCLVLADHGGHDFDHGAGAPQDVTIPWIVSGPSVRRGHPIATPVGIVDTAPTVAHLLGLSPPAEWSGRVVAEALA